MSRFRLMPTLLALAALACVPSSRLLAADSPINLRRTTTVEVVEKTKNAVVYISSRKIVAQRVSLVPNDPFWQNFGDVQMVPVGSLGSGFIIHPDGYIVTNNHVIDRAREIKVELTDGRKYDADLVSADSDADLAILKINAEKPLPALELGDSSDLMIGEPVIAVGNPLGYSHSVSTGIVSAVHRDLKAGGEGAVVLGDLIQTDAAINPGNSGGPLLNAYGQVIGINTAIRGDAQNIGFAIQVNRLRDLIPELMSPAQSTKLDMPIKLKEHRKITEPSTVTSEVERADDGTPVESIAGQKPRDIVDAYAILLKQKADKPFDIVFQNHQTTKVDPKPVPMPDALVKAKSRLGVVVEPVTPMLAGRMQLAIEDGMLVSSVLRNTPADVAGVKPGDIIVQLGRYRITKLSDFSVLLEHLPESGVIKIGVVRTVMGPNGKPAGELRLGYLKLDEANASNTG